MSDRTIKVEALTRVEGEGGLYIRLVGDRIDDVQLNIYEPPRFFEALLRGRALEEVPDITARICGICPVAYQMSSVHALEAALGVTISPEIRTLRRLLYCGEWIESHGLHMHLLNVPDFLGYESGLDMAKDFPDEINRGLRLKKHGNQLVDVLGGRAIHPVNVAVGGFYGMPRREEFDRLIPDFEWAVEAAAETTRWVGNFDFPDLECDHDLISLSHPDEYPMNEGEIVSSDGGRYSVEEYETNFEEQHVAHSTALHSIRKSTGRTYLTGPLARVGLNLDKLSPTARRVAGELDIEWPTSNPFHSIVARGLEMIHAFEEGLQILRNPPRPKPPHIAYDYKAGSGCAATEAPRGTIYHRYEIDDAGKILKAKIVPPTSQNLAQIEQDLRRYIPQVVGDDATLSRECENLVRSYDPCISCSTHFLKLKIDRA